MVCGITKLGEVNDVTSKTLQRQMFAKTAFQDKSDTEKRRKSTSGRKVAPRPTLTSLRWLQAQVTLVIAIALFSSVALVGCFPQEEACIDCDPFLPTSMGNGSSNKTGFGGYWWTYYDRGGKSNIDPDTGKVEPLNPFSSELRSGISLGNGIELDGDNYAYHVHGEVGAAAAVSTEPVLDVYWDAFYSSICAGGECRQPLVPEAGIGFGLKAGNSVLGESSSFGIRGISFRAKVGGKHALNAKEEFRPIEVIAPMDLTDIPDPSFVDEFGSNYDELGKHAIYENLAGETNLPLCIFPGFDSLVSNGLLEDSRSTCLCHFKSNPISLSKDWKTFCVSWSAFRNPGCNGLETTQYPPGGITELIPSRILKILFNAARPKIGEGAARFDFWIDNVLLVKSLSDDAIDSWVQVCGPKSGAIVIE
jgi:hypothetical protein